MIQDISMLKEMAELAMDLARRYAQKAHEQAAEEALDPAPTDDGVDTG